MTVLVDTSAYYALCDVSDQHHGAARRTYRALRAAEDELLTTSYVLLETAQLVQRRLGLANLARFREGVLAATTVIWVDVSLSQTVWDELESIGRRDVTLVDCSLAIVGTGLGITDVFAFDPHFELWGLRLLTAAR